METTEKTIEEFPVELMDAKDNLTEEQKTLLKYRVRAELIRVQSLGKQSLEKELETVKKTIKQNRLQQLLERKDLGNGVAMVWSQLLKSNSTVRTFLFRLIAGTKQIELTPEQVLMFFDEEACAKARKVASLYLAYEEKKK